MSTEFTVYQATNPATPPEVLEDMATRRADLRQFVAANPGTAAQTLEWLGTLGDTAVDAALARRAPSAIAPSPPAGHGPAYGAPPAGSPYPPPGVANPYAAPGVGNPYAAPGVGNPYGPPGVGNPYGPPGVGNPYGPPGAANPNAPPADGHSSPPGPSATGPYGGAYTPAPLGTYGEPVFGYPAATPGRRRTGVVVAIAVGAVVVLAALVFAASSIVGALAGGSYGDDPDLDRLWDACAAGDGTACDDLYWQSPIGSEYEEFGDTCGYRQPAGEVWCEDVLGG